VLYDKGTNREAFIMGKADRYSSKDTGSSFGLFDLPEDAERVVTAFLDTVRAEARPR
jgi:hypothetical protein